MAHVPFMPPKRLSSWGPMVCLLPVPKDLFQSSYFWEDDKAAHSLQYLVTPNSVNSAFKISRESTLPLPPHGLHPSPIPHPCIWPLLLNLTLPMRLTRKQQSFPHILTKSHHFKLWIRCHSFPRIRTPATYSVDLPLQYKWHPSSFEFSVRCSGVWLLWWLQPPAIFTPAKFFTSL